MVSVPTTHHAHIHTTTNFVKKSAFIRCSSIVCRLTWMISHRGQTQAAFQIKVFALCGSVCLRYFFPSRRLNFPHQMEKISIGKEQLHRWWYAQARMQTYAVHGGKKSTNEKSVLLSHKHVTIFISLLGVFLSLRQSSVKILVRSSWSLCCHSQLWSHFFRARALSLSISLLLQRHGVMLHVFRLNTTEW